MSAQSGQSRHVQLLFLGVTEADPRPDQISLASLIWGGQIIRNISQENTMLGFPPGKRLEEVLTADQYITPSDHSYWCRLHWVKHVIINFSLVFDLGRVFFPSLHGDLYCRGYLHLFTLVHFLLFHWLVGRQDRFPRNLCGGWISLTLLDGSCFNIFIRFKGIRHWSFGEKSHVFWWQVS